MKKDKFIIKGLKAPADTSLIEEKINKHKGIETIKINFQSNKLVVIYDNKIIKRSDIIYLIKKLGNYELNEIHKSSKEKIYDEKPINRNTDNSLALGIVTGISVISVILNIILIILLLNK